jgi:hypothetical protein
VHVRKSLAVAAVLAASALNLALLSAPASAGTCDTSGCGGEVSNNTDYSVSISNCWADSYGTYENGDNLPCHGNPVRVANVPNARIWLDPHGWSGSSKYSKFYDTDAVKFPANCVTKWHWWGGGTQTTNRNGAASMWMKINSAQHIYIDSLSC